MSRLFDARDTLVRLILLDISGVGYLLFGGGHDGGGGPDALQLALAVAAFTAILLGQKHLVSNLLVQVVLLIGALWFLDDPTINQVGTSWLLFEVTMSAARLRTVGWCAGLVAAVYLLDAAGDPLDQMASNVFGTATAVLGVPLLAGMVIRTTRELGLQASERAAEEQRRRESEGRAARADERTAIARELHDVVAHHVASMVLRVGVARHVLPGLEPRVAEVFDDVHATGTTALTDLRRLVGVLRDPDGVRGDAALTAIDPSALPAALDGAVENARRAGLVVDAEISGPVGELDAVRGLAVLRLTQEALTNVAKHAGTTAHARLTVAVSPDSVCWEVADDGGAGPVGAGPVGAGPVEAPPGGGHGLVGMRERVEVLGGTLEAGPHGGGWRVRTALPVAS